MALHGLGLGKGLDALIRETVSGSKDGERGNISLKNIVPNPDQPRQHFSEKALEELAASIKNQGLLQPILVRPCGEVHSGKYEIIAGERRWRASQLAGLTEIPVVIRNFSAQETLVAALVENLQREDLNPVEEALGIQVLKEEFALSQEDLSRRLGKSRSSIANSLRLLSLPASIQEEVSLGKLSAGHARALLSITDPESQLLLKEKIIKDSLAVREAEAFATLWKQTGTFENVVSRNDIFFSQKVEGKGSQQRKKSPESLILFEAQEAFCQALGCPVRITGSESKGKISISFSSKADLERIMSLVGKTSRESF